MGECNRKLFVTLLSVCDTPVEFFRKEMNFFLNFAWNVGIIVAFITLASVATSGVLL